MAQKSQNLFFLRAWLANPRQVGAVAPSSPKLASLMTREIDAGTGPVLELGPGTGVFTNALVQRGVKQEDITLVELSDDFADLLTRRFPKAKVLRCDASRLAAAGVSPLRFGAVVSGLPLLAMPVPTVFRIIRGASTMLEAGGCIYQVTYGWRCPVPGAVLEKLGLRAEKMGTVVSNVPPASVYRIAARHAKVASGGMADVSQ